MLSWPKAGLALSLISINVLLIIITSRLRDVDETDGNHFAFHRINSNVPYRFWNPTNGGSLLKRGANNEVNCNGNFGGVNFDTVLTSLSTGQEFAFIFKSSAGPNAKQYVLNATSENQLTAVEMANPQPQNLNEGMKFIPDYFWSFTLFKSKPYSTLYLGCGSNAESILVSMNDTNYPDARALFIANKYSAIGGGGI